MGPSSGQQICVNGEWVNALYGEAWRSAWEYPPELILHPDDYEVYIRWRESVIARRPDPLEPLAEALNERLRPLGLQLVFAKNA